MRCYSDILVISGNLILLSFTGFFMPVGGNRYIYSHAAEVIKPSVSIELKQLLIDGKFVDAASGKDYSL